jgi:chromosomal replication initiator protein
MPSSKQTTMHTIWNQTAKNLEKVISPQNYANWIQPIQFSHADSQSIYLSVPNLFFKEWLGDNYVDLINSALSITADTNMLVSFIVQEKESETVPEEPNETPLAKQAAHQQKETPLHKETSTLNPRYTFDQFVSGAGNQFAHAAAMAVANNPATTYNPLFIYGGVGLGKSHLLNAVGHKIVSDNENTRICYCSAEKFMHDMVNCIKLNKMDEFRARFRSIDVLLIDDIQFIARKERTQVEFFHTFNALYEADKQIIITSDKFPREIDLEDRLRSRFEWGLIADIQAPDLETKIAILKKKADINKIQLPDDVAYLLASSDTRNIRELEGMLIRLGAYSSLQHIPITLTMAKNNLKDILVDKRKEITVELIQKTVADYFGLKVADLKSEKRLKAFVQARQIAIWLCRDMTTASYPDIGARFGGKDHSTVIHATKKIEKLLADDPNLLKTMDALKEIILH